MRLLKNIIYVFGGLDILYFGTLKLLTQLKLGINDYATFDLGIHLLFDMFDFETFDIRRHLILGHI